MARKTYDVIIIGSGAAGGTLSAHLVRQGAEVLLIEGGPWINTYTDFNTHAHPADFLNRQIPIMKAGKEGFDSDRSRGVGGKTLLWNAMALRLSHRDLKGRTLEGAGEDFPFDYPEIAPYYARIEREIGVCGKRDHLKDLPDGIFLPPAGMKCSDHILRQAAKQFGVKVIHARKATRTVSAPSRPACHYCGNCMAGCDVAAKYNSSDVQIRPALKTGKLTVAANSIVYEIPVNSENRVTGARFLNRQTRAHDEALGRIVVVACACVQSVGLLLMSKSRQYPTGLGNSSGHLGQNYIPHFTATIECFLKDLIGKPLQNDEGFLDHAYIPSFMHTRKRDYARSFGVNYGFHNRRSVGFARAMPGIGKSYKDTVRAHYPAYLTLFPFGEMLPNGSYLDLDPEKKDVYGLPLVRRHVVFKENERRMFTDMRNRTLEILNEAGAEILSVTDEPGLNHELGGCRMGTDSRTSVLDGYCRSHDIPNLYVVDGSAFPSASEKNPTLTIMALAARTADHIATRVQRKEM
jgi:choline dehydrogenase-like flavoprotein